MLKKIQSINSFIDSDELLRAFLEHFPGIAFIKDSHSKYLGVNKQFKELFGSLEHLVGKKPDALFPEEIAQRMIDEDRKTLKKGYSVYEENIQVNGSESTFEIHSFRIDREGEEPLIGGIAIDITAWYKSKQALSESEEKYKTVFQNTGTATIIVSSDKTILMANKGFERLSGYAVKDICGKKKWTEFVFSEDLDKMIQYHEDRRSEERHSPNEYEFRFIDKKNNLKSIHLQVDVIPGTSNSVCSLLDISELKNTQEKLLKSIHNRESILRAMPDMMFVISRDGKLLDRWINDFNQLAMPYERIIGSNISDLDLGEEKLQEILGCIHDTIETGVVTTVEYQLNLQSDLRYFEARIALYEEESVIAIIRDITDRKNVENERRELEARIQHTQKLESLGVLSGGIAHDFNNILMAILGNADLALTSIPSTSLASGFLNEIVNAAAAAADLSRQMLAYSGKSNYEILPLDLNKIVVELTHMLEVSISKKAVLKFRLAEKLPSIMADAAQIRQILMNLITNASEAIGSESGVISITTGAMYCDVSYLNTTELSSELDEDIYVYIEVADTGCGMTESARSQLFDPFFTTKSTGRGLGLSSALGIVRGHYGAIKVYSEPGEGTTIKVFFPVNHLDDTETSDSDNIIKAEKWAGKGTVLFADDEDTVLAVGRKMLEHLGFTVIQAEDGLQAIDQFKSNVEDLVLVILDLTMPHLSGDEVYREIRRIRTDIPVIISSGFSREDVIHRFAGKHLAGYLQKPYRMEDLTAIIRKALTEQSE